VFGDNIKDARNCGYARMEAWVVSHVLSSIDESKDKKYREQQEHIQQNTLVESRLILTVVIWKIAEMKKLVVVP